MNLAVIPARGGSKRIPRKNIRPFAGRPMITYAIAAAQASGLFDRVIVSTDDEEIAAVATSGGAEAPFVRPADLSDDHTPTVPVIAHAVSEAHRLGWEVDNVCCIYPAVPLIQASDLVDAFDLLRSTGALYAFPVTEFPSRIQRALRRGADGAASPFLPEYVNVRTQDLEPAYYDCGQFYWGTAAAWTAQENVHLNGRTIVLPGWRVVDIDTPEDWERAEIIFAATAGRSGAQP